MPREILSNIYSEFCKWTGTPSQIRKPKYHFEFAEEHGISRQTLTNYKKRPTFWADVFIETQRWAVDRNSDVIGALYLSCVKDRNPFAFKIWLENLMGITGKIEQNKLLSQPETLTGLIMQNYLERQKRLRQEKTIKGEVSSSERG